MKQGLRLDPTEAVSYSTLHGKQTAQVPVTHLSTLNWVNMSTVLQTAGLDTAQLEAISIPVTTQHVETVNNILIQSSIVQ